MGQRSAERAQLARAGLQSGQASPGEERALASVRRTLAKPRPALRAAVGRHYRALVASVRTLPGGLGAEVSETEDGSGEFGRSSTWERADAADHAATDPHALAMHAALHNDRQGVCWDHSFKTGVSTARP